MWLPAAIVASFNRLRGVTANPGARFGSAGDDRVVGSLAPDVIGNQSRRLPGFYTRTPADDLTDSVPPWGEGGVPLTARGNPLHDSNGVPLV